MDFKEFGQIVFMIQAFYPREDLLSNDAIKEVWFEQLKDIPYDVCQSAIKKWVLTQKWSPSVSEIRELCIELTGGLTPDSGQAWDEVLKAIRKYGYLREAEALASMSPLTRETTMQMGYYELCASENQVADRAHFMQMYDQVARRHKMDSQLSEPLKQRIQEIRGKMIEG